MDYGDWEFELGSDRWEATALILVGFTIMTFAAANSANQVALVMPSSFSILILGRIKVVARARFFIRKKKSA